MTHTPTPWHVGGMGSTDAKGYARIWASDGAGVADVCTRRQLGAKDAPEEKANAAFIVRACNAHDELVAALTAALARFEMDYPNERDGPLSSPRNPGLIRNTKEQIRIVLAKVTP